MADLRLDRIRELAAEIRRAVGQLRSLGSVPQAEFLEDAKALNSAKYLLIVCCEAAIDICNHLACQAWRSRTRRLRRLLRGAPRDEGP